MVPDQLPLDLVAGHRTFEPAPGTAPSPGPKVVPAGELRGVLGITNVVYRPGATALAITDTTLAG